MSVAGPRWCKSDEIPLAKNQTAMADEKSLGEHRLQNIVG